MITHTIAERVARYLEKAGYLVRDAEQENLDLAPDEDHAMNDIVGASITYRLAFGPNAGKKALTLQTVPASDKQAQPNELVSQQRVIACIEDPGVIQKILTHLGLGEASQPRSRAPPATLFDYTTSLL